MSCAQSDNIECFERTVLIVSIMTEGVVTVAGCRARNRLQPQWVWQLNCLRMMLEALRCQKHSMVDLGTQGESEDFC